MDSGQYWAWQSEGLCKFAQSHETLYTDVDKDIIISFQTGAKASGHLQWHIGQFIVDTGQNNFEGLKANSHFVWHDGQWAIEMVTG